MPFNWEATFKLNYKKNINYGFLSKIGKLCKNLKIFDT